MHKRLISCLLSLCIFTLAGCSTGISEKNKRTVFAMDTIISISIFSECDDPQSVLSAAADEINRIDNLLSVTKQDSDVFRINNGNGRPVEVCDETASLIKQSIELSSETDGAFDITVYPAVSCWGFTTDKFRVPTQEELDDISQLIGYSKININGNVITIESGMSIDLGGIAKGYASSRVAEILKAHGVTGALLSFGGAVQTIGSKPDGTSWRIAVTDPDNPDSAVGMLTPVSGAVATSGAYQRNFEDNGVIYHHIIDPKTCKPSESGLKSATVICDDPIRADALSTAVFVMGAEKAIQLQQSDNSFSLVLINEADEVITVGSPSYANIN